MSSQETHRFVAWQCSCLGESMYYNCHCLFIYSLLLVHPLFPVHTLYPFSLILQRDKELFPEGSFAGNVQKLMKKDLNRLGVGGNGEIVEAFYQRKHLVIKQVRDCL